MSREDFDLKFFQECLHYDPETGVFTWKERPLEHFADAKSHLKWIKRSGGKQLKSEGTSYLTIRVQHIAYGRFLFQAHRIAWLLSHGVWPKELMDHIDTNKRNNKLANLREANHRENNMNKATYNRLGAKGVTYSAKRNRYKVNISRDGKKTWVGTYKTLEEAQAAYAVASMAEYKGFQHHSIAQRYQRLLESQTASLGDKHDAV